MATTDGSLRRHTKSKSSIDWTARVCMPHTIDFVSDVKSGLAETNDGAAAATPFAREPSFSSHELRLPTPESWETARDLGA